MLNVSTCRAWVSSTFPRVVSLHEPETGIQAVQASSKDTGLGGLMFFMTIPSSAFTIVRFFLHPFGVR